MSITRDMAQSWWAHRTVVRNHLARGPSEAFIFTFLLVFMILAFIAQYPRAARIAAETPDTPLAPLLLANAYGLLVALPLCYGLAALGQGAARLLGGRGTWFGGRLALFWSLVAASPMVLLHGLTFAILGAGGQADLVGWAAFAAFGIFWILALIEVNRPQADLPAAGGKNAV